MTYVKMEQGANLEAMPLNMVLEVVLTSREQAYIRRLHGKLVAEGITEAKTLMVLPLHLIQKKLDSNGAFIMGDTGGSEATVAH